MMVDELKIMPHRSVDETKWKINHYFAVHGKMADFAVRRERQKYITIFLGFCKDTCVSLSGTTSTAVMSLWSTVKSLEFGIFEMRWDCWDWDRSSHLFSEVIQEL